MRTVLRAKYGEINREDGWRRKTTRKLKELLSGPASFVSEISKISKGRLNKR